MAVPTQTITILAFDGQGNPVVAGTNNQGETVDNVYIELNVVDLDTALGEYVYPEFITAATDENGQVQVELWPNVRGSAGSQYRVRVYNPQGSDKLDVMATVQEVDQNLADIAELPPPTTKDAITLATETAQGYAAEAQNWANRPEDSLVPEGDGVDDYSSLHHRNKAADSASAASTSASNASTSETNAATSASNAATSETNASNSASAAATSESNAASSASAASTSETNAATSETNAANSASAASTSETNAATSETNAANSASAASTSETNAANSASAASTSESNAATSETNAANSASAASTSETNAGNSASAAATSETNAATSETNAANSASAASTSESNAATSASNASASETNAASSASAAQTAETNAETAETNAQGYANTAFTESTQEIQTTKGCELNGAAQDVTVAEGDDIIEFIGSAYDTDNFFNIGSSASRITIPSAYAGYFAEFTFRASFQGEALQRGAVVQLLRNGTAMTGEAHYFPTNSSGSYQNFSFSQIQLADGDYYEIQAFNLSGSTTLDIFAPLLKMRVVGAPVGSEPLKGIDISSFSYTSDTFSAGSQTTQVQALAASSDASQVYTVDSSARVVYQYTLSTPGDLSTASYSGNSFDASSEGGSPLTGVFISDDGTAMYLLMNGVVYQYTLSTPGDVSTASYDTISFTLPIGGGGGRGDIYLNPTLDRLYTVTYSSGGEIHQFTLETPGDVSTALEASQITYRVPYDDELQGVAVDRNRIFVSSSSTDLIYQFTLPHTWDATVVLDPRINLDVSGQVSNPNGLALLDGSIITATNNGGVFRYQ